jgi:hypothetical protein
VRRFVIVAAVPVLVAAGIFAGRQLALSLAASDAPGHAFQLSGTAGGLAPGKPVPMKVTVTNPEAQPIRLLAATATAQPAGRDCPADLIAVTAFAGTPQTVVPARGRAEITLTITLSAQAPNASRRVSFPLTYTGRAEQWQ